MFGVKRVAAFDGVRAYFVTLFVVLCTGNPKGNRPFGGPHILTQLQSERKPSVVEGASW